jgi:hypothetical protein
VDLGEEFAKLVTLTAARTLLGELPHAPSKRPDAAAQIHGHAPAPIGAALHCSLAAAAAVLWAAPRRAAIATQGAADSCHQAFPRPSCR